MRRRTFKPKDYSISTGKVLDGDAITSKGVTDTFEVDINDITVVLDNLVPYSQTPIRALTGKPKEEFNEIVGLVKIFHSTRYYDIFHAAIVERFPAVNLQPGTVGAYMAGCLSDENSCSPLCAGSAPPAQPNWQPCTNRVIVALPIAGGYTFSSLNQIDSQRAIIYIPELSYTQFPGFTSEEKVALANLGVSEAQIVGHSSGNYSDLTDGYVPVAQLKTREITTNVGTSTATIQTERANAVVTNGAVADAVAVQAAKSRQPYNVAFVILFIVIILILLFAAWRIWYS